MKLPWTKQPEIRESSYTDTLVSLILQRANGKVAKATATAAVQTCAGIVARSFAAAVIEGPEPLTRGLTPDIMALIGRALIRQGEICLLMDVKNGMVKLWPVSDFDVTGGYDPESWRYRVNLPGPDRLMTRPVVMSAGLLHFRYCSDPERPWKGISPITSAALAGKLSAETTAALSDESASDQAQLVPVPNTSPDLTKLRADVKAANADVMFVESQSSGWDEAGGERPGSNDWRAQRLGPNPPESMVKLQAQASREILMACGFSPALFDTSAAAAARESWRQALHGVIAPMARILEAELSEKMEAKITLNFANLMASDIMGRARSFQSMVAAGMDITKAAGLSGLMETE